MILATDAIVLHAFDYMETSRIYRLLTYEAGVQSVLARGARRAKSRFGTAMDLFAEGEAHISVRPNRELQTLTGFDVTRARSALGRHLGRFGGATALAELALRFVRDDHNPAVFEAVKNGLDTIAEADDAQSATLGAAWCLIATLGFAPAIDHCSMCHSEVPVDIPARFSHPAGGTLCANCRAHAGTTRLLPPSARAALATWTQGGMHGVGDAAEVRAHKRLLREFVWEHLLEGAPLRAFEVWADDRLGAEKIEVANGSA